MAGPGDGSERAREKEVSEEGCGFSRSWSLEVIPPSASNVGLGAPEDADWEQVPEAKADLVLTVADMVDILRHCKGCSECSSKIRDSIPRILKRIQKLIDCATDKKGVRADDRVRLPGTGSARAEETSEDPQALEQRKKYRPSEKVEAVAVSEDHPGVQVLLQVERPTTAKKLFARAGNLKVGTGIGAYPTLHLEESVGFSLVRILRLGAPSGGLRGGKGFAVEGVGFGFGAVSWREPSRAVRGLAGPGGAYEEAGARGQGRGRDRESAVEERSEGGAGMEAQEPFPGAPEEGERQVRRVQELEGEVRGLKQLMVEVHRNQMELNRVVVEKGLGWRRPSAAAGPAALEEEREVLERSECLERKNSFIEALQLKVEDLKRKCFVKNKTIVTLLKGLRSDVPKEWWEEVVEYIFDDEADAEKVDECIRRTSLFLLDEEKGSTVPPPALQNEGLSPEEEPKTSGAAVEDVLKNVSLFNEIDEKRSGTFPEDGPPLAFWALPGARVCDAGAAELTLKRLEDQVSLLNEENYRLRQHVDDLEEVLKTRVNETDGNENIRPEPSQETNQARKTISLTVRTEERGVPGQRGEKEGRGESDRGPPLNKFPQIKFRSNPSPRRSASGLDCVEDPSAAVAEWARPLPRKKEKLRSLTSQEKGTPTAASARRLLCLPDNSFGLALPPGGSPPVPAATSRERQLRTIPENEQPDWAPEGASESGQRLRARPRFVHEDFDYLGSNCGGGIDQLLDSLVENIVNKKESERGGLESSSAEFLEGAGQRPLCFSSFIQDVLCDDFRAGATIVDLFVAVKSAKDNLNVLSRSKSLALLRMKELTEETGALREKVRALLGDMEHALSRMNEEVERWASKGWQGREKEARSAVEGAEERREGTKGGEGTREKEEEEEEEEEGGRGGPGERACAEYAKKVRVGPAGGSESTVDGGEWEASVAGGFRGEQAEAKKSEGGAHLSDSAVQLICDICGILAGPEEEEVEGLADSEKNGAATHYSDADSGKLFCWNCGTKLPKEVIEKWHACEKDSGKKGDAPRGKGCEDDAASETESVFEEALSDPYPVVVDSRAKPSVTCMGDLTKVVKEKKSVSTLTATNDAPSSWVGQFTEDIKSKIKSLRSIKAVTDRSATSLSGIMELTIIANTPAGIFDVNVKQYKDRKRKSGIAGGSADVASAASHAVAPVTTSGVESGGYFWSDENLFSDCAVDNGSDPVSGHNDFEEFLRLSTESQEKGSERILCAPRKKGTVMAMLKAVVAPLFEVLRCEPRPFIQEILPKETGAAPGGRWEGEAHVDIQGGRCEELSRLPQSGRLVIENDSSDLIIVVKVEVDKAAGNLEEAEIWEESEETKESAESTTTRPEAEEWEKANEKSGTFCDELSDSGQEKEIREMFPEEPKMWATAAGYVVMKSVARVVVCLRQALFLQIYEIDRKKEERREVKQRRADPELDKALGLIREIEKDVMEVKLSDAILTLPRLEWELQNHHRRKTWQAEREKEESEADSNGEVEDESEERLRKLLSLMSGLEQAVELSECDVREQNSSQILEVLRALERSVRELEEEEVEEGEVEEEEASSGSVASEAREEGGLEEELPGKERLRSVRRKVFQVVEKEAVATEGRVEGDLDRIDCLARENDEVSMFVDVFQEKTQRRAWELNTVKAELSKLLSDVETTEGSFSKTPSEELDPSSGEKPPANAVSALLSALDSLKFRAGKKSEICRDILGLDSKKNQHLPPEIPEEESQKISIDSFFPSEPPDFASSIKDFRQLGDNSFYLSWTKPEGPLADSVAGYEILVNGKRHQKVRNPKRLQAILYSVDLSDGTEVQLQAVVENGPKTLLATVTYQRER